MKKESHNEMYALEMKEIRRLLCLAAFMLCCMDTGINTVIRKVLDKCEEDKAFSLTNILWIQFLAMNPFRGKNDSTVCDAVMIFQVYRAHACLCEISSLNHPLHFLLLSVRRTTSDLPLSPFRRASLPETSHSNSYLEETSLKIWNDIA